MSIIVNGTTIPNSLGSIKVNNTNVTKVNVVKDGVTTTVWTSQVDDLFINGSFNIQPSSYGEWSIYDGQLYTALHVNEETVVCEGLMVTIDVSSINTITVSFKRQHWGSTDCSSTTKLTATCGSVSVTKDHHTGDGSSSTDTDNIVLDVSTLTGNQVFKLYTFLNCRDGEPYNWTAEHVYWISSITFD